MRTMRTTKSPKARARRMTTIKKTSPRAPPSPSAQGPASAPPPASSASRSSPSSSSSSCAAAVPRAPRPTSRGTPSRAPCPAAGGITGTGPGRRRRSAAWRRWTLARGGTRICCLGCSPPPTYDAREVVGDVLWRRGCGEPCRMTGWCDVGPGVRSLSNILFVHSRHLVESNSHVRLAPSWW